MSASAAKAIVNAPNVFSVSIQPCVDTKGYFAICDTPNGGCVTQGTTLQEVQKNMIEAVEIHLEDCPEFTNYYLTFEVSHA